MHTVDAKEIENFSKDSASWWDENGPFRPLHRLNPVRLAYIKEQICRHYGLDALSFKPYTGLSILDIGCGGGLVCEPMARLGADVTGVDADMRAIETAKEHAAGSGLSIRYVATSTDQLLSPPPRAGVRMPAQGGHDKYDIVLALEIVEHVANVEKFVRDCADLCKPGGLIVFSTLNRTPQSFLLGKIAAEYILGWVPKGTHDWKKFLKPSELARAVRMAGAEIESIEGMVFDPIARNFRRGRDVGVNYFLSAVKA